MEISRPSHGYNPTMITTSNFGEAAIASNGVRRREGADQPVRQILIVGPAWVGDMVMAQCLFASLKAQQPLCAIDVLAPAWSEPLLARMPEVRKSFSLPVGHGELALGVRRQVAKSLRQTGYQQAIVLPNSFKSALVPFFAGIPTRTGWRGEMRYGLINDLRVLDKARYPLMIQRFAALAYAANNPLPANVPWPRLLTSAEDGRAALLKQHLNVVRPVLALCPGAEFGSSKRWPEAHYAQVAEAKIREGWQVWIFGSGNDRPVAAAIASALPVELATHCHNLAGNTSLGEAIDLLALADCVVSNDSGLMHIAAALARPLVVVYGSTSPGFTPPLAEQVAILSLPVDCGPCFERQCPLEHHQCMQGVAPGRVLAAIEELVGREAVL